MPTSAAFWNKAADKYVDRPIGDMAAYEDTLARTQAHLNKDQSVLELGCGSGMTALKHAPFAGHITATDISGNMVDHGRAAAAASGVENITFLTATLDEGLPANETYDVVLALNLIHLFEDPSKAIQQIADRVKPGGLFISKTPCLKDGPFILPMAVSIMRLFGKAPVVRFFTQAQLELMIREAGFEVVEADDIPAGKANHFVVARKSG